MNIDQINQTLVRVFNKSLLFFGVSLLARPLAQWLARLLVRSGGDNPGNIILHQLRIGTGIGFCKKKKIFNARSEFVGPSHLFKHPIDNTANQPRDFLRRLNLHGYDRPLFNTSKAGDARNPILI